MTDADLIHFVDAQAKVYRQVVEELTNERTRTHWMWFVFPQLSSLGQSAMAQRYAIRDLDRRGVIWLTLFWVTACATT